MKALKAKFATYAQDESGATMIEYALIAALISVAAITILGQVGTGVKTTFTKIESQID